MMDEGLPPHLGLIESANAGETWRRISLLGQADFHVLRFLGGRIYGYDASNDRLLVSATGGRGWKQTGRPTPLLDLAVEPKSRRMIASGQGGLYTSTNGGLAWTRLSATIGLLSWPATSRLYLADARGIVRLSADQGTTWTRIGTLGGEPAAFLAHDATELYAALHDGTIKQSTDGGRSWRVRSTP